MTLPLCSLSTQSELGWDMQIPAVCLPLLRLQNSTLLLVLTHTPSLVQRADCREGRALSAALEQSCTCVYGA